MLQVAQEEVRSSHGAGSRVSDHSHTYSITLVVPEDDAAGFETVL